MSLPFTRVLELESVFIPVAFPRQSNGKCDGAHEFLRQSSFCSAALLFITGLCASICSFSRHPVNTYHVVSTKERKMKDELWVCSTAVHSPGKRTDLQVTASVLVSFGLPYHYPSILNYVLEYNLREKKSNLLGEKSEF